MFKKILSLTLLLLVPGLSVAGENQDYELSRWTTGIGVGGMFFEGDEEFDSTGIAELKFGYDLCEYTTLELGLGWMPFLDSRSKNELDPEAWHLDNSQAFRGAFDALYHLGEPGTTRPNLAVTGGVTYFSNSLRGGDHYVPFTGVGAGISHPLNDYLTGRADYRLLYTFDNDEFNHLALFSVMYRWGSSKSSMTSGSHMKDDVSGEHISSAGMQTIYFDFDQALLTGEAKARLDNNARYLRDNPSVDIVVEGHCDERGTTEYNLALGQRRAQSAMKYLQALGVSADRMSTVSYGEERPAVNASNEDAYSKNRRVVCVAK